MFSVWSALPQAALPSSLLSLQDLIPLGRWPLILLGTLLLLQFLRRKSGAPLLQLVGEMLIVIPAYFLYFLVRGFVQGREAEAIERAVKIIDFQKGLNIFWEPALQSYMLRFDWLVTLANWVYIWGHWPVIVFVALWLFLLHRENYAVYRNAFLISGAIGLAIFAFFPVAPPRLVDGIGMIDTIAENSGAYRMLQPPAFVNQYAAMPSLHFGWNLLVGIAIARHGTGLLMKSLGLFSPLLMLASIVLTANHFIIDAFAGGALAVLGLLIAYLIHQRGKGEEIESPSQGQQISAPAA